LGNLADVIIPPGETPGARAVEAHLFTLIMVDECLDKAEQEKYLKGMRMFDESVKPLTGKTFTKASPEERLTILTNLEASLDKFPEEVRAFYGRSRGYILQGYLTSQHFLTNVKPFKHIPGPQFKGCAPVTQNQTPV
jgi:hypothetical protein